MNAIENWLNQVLPGIYSNYNRVFNDVSAVISKHKTLSLKTEIFALSPTLNDRNCPKFSSDLQHSTAQVTLYNKVDFQGNHFDMRNQLPLPSLMLNIYGTLPITYLQQQYQIPVSIHLPPNYPLQSPIAKVTPTEYMLIKPTRCVNYAGRFFHPLLNGWVADNQEYYNLAQLIHFMIVSFNQEPPVFSRGVPNSSTPPEYNRANGAISLLDSEQPIGDVHQLKSSLKAKISKRFQQFNTETQQTINQLLHLNRKLNRNSEKLDFSFRQLTGLKGRLSLNFKFIEQSQKQLDENIGTLESLRKPSVGDLHFNLNPNSVKLLDLIAEESTIEDAIYYLSQALQDEIIDLNSYLKSVRSLGRKQFLLRAHMIKIYNTTKGAESDQHTMAHAMLFSYMERF
ncbi:hypothetical protein CONCODRAFT_71365 [Conidiobolus coronatus NRRL 28638]|uniref:UEV-domain-containing protein n=1 Tax=Conidiobolus coronatus (strain ATCC 28846 / CBS 209.66 / NRRL 28638) TaxID=796925 RepID=A0A137P3G2_CONC2|nr:hypothetical protein CONCODRAFT_71365 [Conidiobolus coronatus NRRL 28638]|eukprot:KXN69555.1 hypothetical protein CONCODRAFT_71365 [Conidiobolus coronatus NRRL 28638]